MGFQPLKKTVSPHMKNYNTFSQIVFEIADQLQLALVTALFSAMNEWQHILLLKRELSQLFFVLEKLLLLTINLHIWNSLFLYSSQYLTRSMSSLVRYQVEH